MRENVLEPHRRDGRRLDRQDGAARAQVAAGYDLTRLLGRLGGHARHHHRAHRAPLRHPREDPRGRVPLRDAGGRLQRRDPVDPARSRRGAHGAARPAADQGRQRLRQARSSRRSRRCSSSSTAPRPARATRSSSSRPSPRAKARSGFDWAEKEEERRRLWKARHDAYWAVKTVWPGKDALATDVCVPVSRLAECVVETQKDIEELGLIAPIVGHVGDGNFHTSPVFDRNDPKEMAAIETFLERLAERAIAMEGTCTGEHGVGQGKRKYLQGRTGRRPRRHARDQVRIGPPRHLQSRQDLSRVRWHRGCDVARGPCCLLISVYRTWNWVRLHVSVRIGHEHGQYGQGNVLRSVIRRIVGIMTGDQWHVVVSQAHPGARNRIRASRYHRPEQLIGLLR